MSKRIKRPMVRYYLRVFRAWYRRKRLAYREWRGYETDLYDLRGTYPPDPYGRRGEEIVADQRDDLTDEEIKIECALRELEEALQ